MKWALILSPWQWRRFLSSGPQSDRSSPPPQSMAEYAQTFGTFTNPPPEPMSGSILLFNDESQVMKTLTAFVPNPDTLMLERHVITTSESAGLDHSINGVHRAHVENEHAVAYIESLGFPLTEA